MANDPGRAYLYSAPAGNKAKTDQQQRLPRQAAASYANTSTSNTQQRSNNSGHPSPGQQQRSHRSPQVAPQTSYHSAQPPAVQGSRRATPGTTVGEGSAPQNGHLGQWAAAIGNIEDARVALDTVARAIDDAVYLDEDAYNQVAPTSQYMRTIQAQQRRITELEAELEEVRASSQANADRCRRAEQQLAEAEGQLENNTVVFKMHYSELLAKDAELQRLKAIIEGLT